MNEKPIIQRKDGNINMSVFYNIGSDGKGYYSITLQRSYKKKGSEEWTRETIGMFQDDLLKLENIAGCTYTDIKADEYKRKQAAKDANIRSRGKYVYRKQIISTTGI